MWTNPPTFTEDGLPLEEGPMNALSDNAAWLYAQVRRIAPAMPTYHVPWVVDYQYIEQVQAQWRIRHVGRYLVVRIYGKTHEAVPANAQDRPGFKLYYDDRLILDKQWPTDNTTKKWIGDFTVDLEAALPGLVIGVRYQISVVHTPNDFGGEDGFFELSYIYETEMVT